MKSKYVFALLGVLLVQGCASELLRAPDLDDNKLYSQCSKELVEVYDVMTKHRANMSPQLRQRLISLLVSAEIDSQFKHFPYCADKLARARYYLQQARLVQVN